MIRAMSSRRHFLSALAAPAFLYAQKARRYRTALIGTGWWGMNILNAAMAAGESEVVALCDVDQNQLEKAAAEVEKVTSDRPRRYRDYRELLAKERPEIAIVATPDHWHPLVMIEAVKQGAHVYVEKPISHTLLEGRAMVNAARAADRVVQVGMHRRVSPHNKTGFEFLRSGRVGRIGMIRAFVHYGGGPGQPTPDAEPPKGLDWDFWVGPAPTRPFNPNIHPKGFRQYLDFANGQLGDWGVHWMDQILWTMDEKYPKRVYSTGGRRIKRDSTDAPDTQIATYDFDRFQVVWEHRLYGANEAEKSNVGCYFYGTEGTFHMGWQDGWTFYPSNKNDRIEHDTPKLNKPDDQNIRELWGDFLASIKTKTRPVCDIEIGHRSTNMSLLGMLSMKLGRSIEWDGAKEQIPGDPAANALLKRNYRGPWKYPTA
jgi:predicted dehydrogenase